MPQVVELDSPYSATVKSGTHVYSFVLMGDQNAGKSTFLHSFSHNTDLNYLELSSLLPVLSASFVNTRVYACSFDVGTSSTLLNFN